MVVRRRAKGQSNHIYEVKQIDQHRFNGLKENARILLFSQRNFDLKVYQGWMYEFEDLISEVDSVDLVAPLPRAESNLSRLARRSLNCLRMHTGLLSDSILIDEFIVSKDYEVFFSVFLFPQQLPLLKKIKNWRQRCNKAVCFLGEVWTKDAKALSKHLELLKDFDYIFIHVKSSIPMVSDIIGQPCHFMPVGIDAAKFCPYPLPPERNIDCYSMGRRSSATHLALLRLAELKKIFYVYDTANGFTVSHYKEHRNMIANMIKRSRYFISYRHNTSLNHITGGQEALGARLFEGTAGGAIMLGSAPQCEEYLECFDWPDAVISIPYDPPNLEAILADLDSTPERLSRARRDNIINSLLRHDWVYRWEHILNVAGIEGTVVMKERETQLQKLAALAATEQDIISERTS